jgi:hypothetical protein
LNHVIKYKNRHFAVSAQRSTAKKAGSNYFQVTVGRTKQVYNVQQATALRRQLDAFLTTGK